MKLIESNVELLKQEPGMTGINKMIELAGRTCYKSEDKITEDSAEAFVQRMINSYHTAMLEHGTVYLKIPLDDWQSITNVFDTDFFECPYKKDNTISEGSEYFVCISTNLRVLLEYDYMNLLEYLYEPTSEEFEKGHFEKRISLKFITDRGVSHELVRHRVFSFAQESTRYCNYSKDKFGNEITFIIPHWLKISKGHTIQEIENKSMDVMSSIEFKKYFDYNSCEFVYTIGSLEWHYLNLIKNGLQPQQARQVLPNALKTEIVMTGFASDWKHFFDLRLFGITGKPHPDMLLLAEKAKKVLEENNLLEYIMSQPSKFK